jgi:hypothetical protein
MPSSIDVPLNTADYDAPMAFRRERYWFLSFMTTPFKDIDDRATEQWSDHKPGEQRRR